MSGERVMITSAQERFALAACRSLAAAGYRVSAVADVTPAATHWSRCCERRFVLVDPKEDADEFVDGLAAILAREAHAVLLPATDAALLAVSSRRDRLEPLVRLGLPPHDVVVAATDKVRLVEAARAAGLDAPATVVCETPADGRRAAGSIGYPVVVKPRCTAFEAEGRVRQRGSVLVAEPAQLDGQLEAFGRPYLVQRAQRGAVWSVAGVRTAEGLPAFAVARYVRTYPPEAGNVAFAETVEPPAGLRDRVEVFLSELGWEGIFELELIRDEDGRFQAIDMNPRLYGSLALATRAGAPLAVVLCDWILGRPLRPVTARPGVRYRWEDADLGYALSQLRRRRLRAAAAALRPRHDVAHAHFRLADPGPLAARAIVVGRRALRRARG
jgi:predicted ATP-grasp superfamily ATP-dependent carboligase